MGTCFMVMRGYGGFVASNAAGVQSLLMSARDLFSEVARITLLSPQLFEKELVPLMQAPALISLLANVLLSPLSVEQKQLAAVGINRTLRHRLDRSPQEWPHLWDDFLQHVLIHPEAGRMEWRILTVLGKGLQALLEEMQAELCSVVNRIFARLPFRSKALLYDAFLFVQTTEETRYVFIRETIEAYIRQALHFTCQRHDSHEMTPDGVKLQTSVLETLVAVMGKVSGYTEGRTYDLALKLSQNGDLFQLVLEHLLYDRDNPHFQSVLRLDFAPERMGEILVGCKAKEDEEGLKARAIQLYTSLLAQYDLKAGIAQFDHLKHLLFMQNLTPMAIDYLSRISPHCDSHMELTIALLRFLNRSCRFNFMLQTFQNHFERIFYQICIPCLQTSPDQRDDYQSNDAEFIRAYEELLQSHEEQAETVKNCAGNLAEELVSVIHGSLLFVVQNSIQTIRQVLLGEQSLQVQQASTQYGYKPSIDTSLLVLALFSSHYLHRPDLFQTMRKELATIEPLLQLRGIDRVRLLLFMSYNYEELFAPQPDLGKRFLIMAEHALQQQGITAQSALLLLKNCLQVGFGDDLWQNLMSRLQQTALSGVFRLINCILEKMLNSLPLPKTEELVNRVIGRLVTEFGRCESTSQGGSINGNQFVYLCLDVISTVVSNSQYLKEEPSLIKAIWPVFDLFEFSSRIEFEDNLLHIFNKILNAEPLLARPHFQFMHHFPAIHEKQGGFGELTETVRLFLTKGREYLLGEEQGRQDLLRLSNFLKQTYGVVKHEDTLKLVLLYHSYLHLEYYPALPFDQHLHDALLEVYQREKTIMREETMAAVVNFILMAHARFGGCEFPIIWENRIEIFHGCQAHLFAVGLRLAIERDWQEEHLLLAHLRCAIRLLHFLREITLHATPPHKYFDPGLPELSLIDPFAEIGLALNFVRQNLEARDYDLILQELKKEISLGEIKDLLSRRIVDHSMRTIKRVRLP